MHYYFSHRKEQASSPLVSPTLIVQPPHQQHGMKSTIMLLPLLKTFTLKVKSIEVGHMRLKIRLLPIFPASVPTLSPTCICHYTSVPLFCCPICPVGPSHHSSPPFISRQWLTLLDWTSPPPGKNSQDSLLSIKVNASLPHILSLQYSLSCVPRAFWSSHSLHCELCEGRILWSTLL